MCSLGCHIGIVTFFVTVMVQLMSFVKGLSIIILLFVRLAPHPFIVTQGIMAPLVGAGPGSDTILLFDLRSWPSSSSWAFALHPAMVSAIYPLYEPTDSSAKPYALNPKP